MNLDLWDFFELIQRSCGLNYCIGTGSTIWCLGFEGDKIFPGKWKDSVWIPEEMSGREREHFRVSGLFYAGMEGRGATSNPPSPGECSVRGLGLQQLIQPLPSYQHVNSSHGSETFILLCNLAVLSNRLSIVYFWNNCTLFAGFWWVQSPSTYISLRGPLILLWRN